MTNGDYINGINAASKEIYKWFKARLPDGTKNGEWIEEAAKELTSLVSKFKGKPGAGYAIKYGVACFDELERLATGKPDKEQYKSLGIVSIKELEEYLSGNPEAGDSVMIKVGNRLVRATIERIAKDG